MILLRPCECAMRAGFLGGRDGVTRLCPRCLGVRTDADAKFALGVISRLGRKELEWEPVVPVASPAPATGQQSGAGHAVRTRIYLTWVRWTYRLLGSGR